MSRRFSTRLAHLGLGSGMATLMMLSHLGISGRAQTIEETGEAEVPAEATGPESDAASDGANAGEDATAAEMPRFTCQLYNGQYTVMYLPESQPEQAYPWAAPGDMGSSWPAQRRCNEISARLESYRPDGLSELQTGLENGYNTVCVTTETMPTCRIVFTVPAGQDPMMTRDQVFENLALADQGQQTQGVNTFVGGNSSVLDQIGEVLGTGTNPMGPTSSSSGINLKPFLAPEDGGTGTQLTAGNSSGGRSLNPDNFR